MSNDNSFDTRKSDQTALSLLRSLKDANLVERFIKLRKEYGRFDAIERKGNVLYPITLREGVYLRSFLRELGEDEWKWKEKLGIAIMYYEHPEKIGSGTRD